MLLPGQHHIPITRIFREAPTSWQKLQERVRRILQEAGYEAECNKRIETVRGSRNVDVYAVHTDRSRAPRFTIICECKQWNRRVPRQVVDAFQSLGTGAGANIGYIISKKGYQKGAYEAAKHTSIKLLTYWEFERELFMQWHSHQKAVLSKMVMAAFDQVDKVNPKRDMYARSNAKLMKIIKRLWRRSQILRDAGWVSNEWGIYQSFNGPMPGSYSGRDKVLNINELHDYTREIRRACKWITKEVTELGVALTSRVYVNGRAVPFSRLRYLP